MSWFGPPNSLFFCSASSNAFAFAFNFSPPPPCLKSFDRFSAASLYGISYEIQMKSDDMYENTQDMYVHCYYYLPVISSSLLTAQVTRHSLCPCLLYQHLMKNIHSILIPFPRYFVCFTKMQHALIMPNLTFETL